MLRCGQYYVVTIIRRKHIDLSAFSRADKSISCVHAP